LAERIEVDGEDEDEKKDNEPEESSAFEEKKREMKDSAKASLSVSAIPEV
jgi:hypothetical protein